MANLLCVKYVFILGQIQLAISADARNVDILTSSYLSTPQGHVG